MLRTCYGLATLCFNDTGTCRWARQDKGQKKNIAGGRKVSIGVLPNFFLGGTEPSLPLKYFDNA